MRIEVMIHHDYFKLCIFEASKRAGLHEAVHKLVYYLLAKEGLPILASVQGRLVKVAVPSSSWSCKDVEGVLTGGLGVQLRLIREEEVMLQDLQGRLDFVSAAHMLAKGLLRMACRRVGLRFSQIGAEGLVFAREGERVEHVVYVNSLDPSEGSMIFDVFVDVRRPRPRASSLEPGWYLDKLMRVRAHGVKLRPRAGRPQYLVAVLNVKICEFTLPNVTLYEYYVSGGVEDVEPNDLVVVVLNVEDPSALTEAYAVINESKDLILGAKSSSELDEVNKQLEKALGSSKARLLAYPADRVELLEALEDEGEEDEEEEALTIREKYMKLNELIDRLTNALNRLSLKGMRVAAEQATWIDSGDIYVVRLLHDKLTRHYVKVDGGSTAGSALELCYKVEMEGKEELARTQLSPAAAFVRGYKPVGKRLNVLLGVIYPENLSEAEVTHFAEAIARKYKEMNLGELEHITHCARGYRRESLRWDEALASAVEELVGRLRQGSEGIADAIPLIMVISIHEGRSEVHSIAKRRAAFHGMHAMVVKRSTVNKVLSSDASADSVAANIALNVYWEAFTTQLKDPEGFLDTPWRLSSPADGRGLTAYMGVDVGGSEEDGAARTSMVLAVTDPWGSAVYVDALEMARGVRGERVPLSLYESAVRAVRRFLDEVGLKSIRRLYIMRDGYPTPSELREFDKVREYAARFSFDDLTYTGVVKRNRVLLVAVKGGERVGNPIPGTIVRLGTYIEPRSGMRAEVVAVQAGHQQEGRKVSDPGDLKAHRPVVLWIFRSDGRSWRGIAAEYAALTRLNYSNAVTGLSKLALPVLLTDTLARIARSGVPLHAIRVRARKFIKRPGEPCLPLKRGRAGSRGKRARRKAEERGSAGGRSRESLREG